MAANKGKKEVVHPQMIQFVGLNELSDPEQAVVNELSGGYFDKLKHDLPDLERVIVHVKKYGAVEGKDKRCKYSVHIKVQDHRNVFDADSAQDWDLPRAMHKGFEDVRKQAQHKLHTDVTHHKNYC